MNTKRRIEVFSAGCAVCEETVAMVKRLACPSCDVAVLDMRDPRLLPRQETMASHAFPQSSLMASWPTAAREPARTSRRLKRPGSARRCPNVSRWNT
jgi:glutaredoxin 3